MCRALWSRYTFAAETAPLAAPRRAEETATLVAQRRRIALAEHLSVRRLRKTVAPVLLRVTIVPDIE